MSLKDTADMLLDSPSLIMERRLRLYKFPDGNFKVELFPSNISVDHCQLLSVLFMVAAGHYAQEGWDAVVKAVNDEAEKARIVGGIPCKRTTWPGW